jgi:hypothetical protein
MGISQDETEDLTSEEIKEVVDSMGSILERMYVFPDVGMKMNKMLTTKHENGEYDNFKDPREFAQVLTEDIRSINNDLHLRVGFDPASIARFRNVRTAADSIVMEERMRKEDRRNNYGFQKVHLMEGNIGYLQLNAFFGVTEEAGETAQAAMNLLSNADALIIDLRQNGGGSPQMIQLITSYLFDEEPVHLNSFYYRPQDEITQTWTLPYVPGKRRPDVDVYVLTSKNTFSAAEEFSYNLRNLERATLIGEVTGGGAHPGGTQIATERYSVWVPTGRAINPITETNWEGVGVKPHIEIESKKALEKAHLIALETIMNKSETEDQAFYEWHITSIKAGLNPTELSEETMKAFVGQYGPRTISYDSGELFYQRAGNDKHKLIPISKTMFMIEEIPYFRVEIEMENGQPVAIIGHYNNGRTDRSTRHVNEGTK